MKRRMLALFLALFLGIALTGCADVQSNNGPYKMYLIAKSTTTEFWKSVFAGANAAKSEYNVDLTVLQLAVVTGGGEVSYDFRQMVQEFNTGQDRYRIEYETYSDSEYDTDAASLDVLRTQIMAGQGPDLFAFYDINGFNPPALRAEAVCAYLLPLTVDFLTEENLLPGLYRLLEQDGAVYELPLTV